MAGAFPEQPTASKMTRLRQISLATVCLSIVIVDCIPLLRPELGAEPWSVAMAWLALAFPLLVPSSLIDRLPPLRSIARHDLLVGPAMILAMIAFPLLVKVGWVGIGIIAIATAAALVDHVIACIQRHGIDLLWLWVPTIVLCGVAIALFTAPPAMENAFFLWVDMLRGPSFENDSHVVLLVTTLPFLIASLAMAGIVVGGTLREHSTTALIALLGALFFAVSLPSLGMGPSSLINGTLLLAAAVLSLGIAPLFVLASEVSVETPAPALAIWGFALALVLILSALDGAMGLVWTIVLLAWVHRHYGVKARFFQIMAAAALVIWAVAETAVGHWQMFDGAMPFGRPFAITLWQEERIGALVGSHVIIIVTLMLTTLGFQRGAQDVRKYTMLTLLVAVAIIELLILVAGLTEGPALRFLAAAGWLAMPFLLGEMLALLPSGPAVYFFGRKSFSTRG